MKLYSPELLALSASLAEYPLGDEHVRKGEARSRTCGSSIELGLREGEDHVIADVGLRVSACAVGQSAAAVFARAAPGRTLDQIADALSEIEAWLSEPEAALPDWPGFAALQPAREHAGRHEALKLPWRAAISALSTEPSPS